MKNKTLRKESLSSKGDLKIKKKKKYETIRQEQNTNTRTGNPFFLKMLTALRPTPPVAPATRTMPEVSIFLSGLLGDGPDSFSIKASINFTNNKF